MQTKEPNNYDLSNKNGFDFSEGIYGQKSLRKSLPYVNQL